MKLCAKMGGDTNVSIETISGAFKWLCGFYHIFIHVYTKQSISPRKLPRKKSEFRPDFRNKNSSAKKKVFSLRSDKGVGKAN